MIERADVFIHNVKKNTFVKGWIAPIGVHTIQLEIDTNIHPHLKDGTICFDHVLQLWCKGPAYES